MRRIVTAREQVELLAPWLGEVRTASMKELDWKPEGEDWLGHPDENDSVHTANSDDWHSYHVLAPWRHDAVAVNGFGERVKSEHPDMWALIHRYEPNIGWEHQVTYHPTQDHAKGAAEHHHVTGEAPSKWPGTVSHSDYDEDRVEMWPELAEDFENRDDDDDTGEEENTPDWNPDDKQDPFDPRIIGASYRRKEKGL
jgi:hypothetical protein